MSSSQADSIPPAERLVVKGLPLDSTDDWIRQIFAQYGTVKDAKMLPGDGGGSAAAHLTLATLEEAKWIKETIHANVPHGLEKPVEISYAKPSRFSFSDAPAPPAAGMHRDASGVLYARPTPGAPPVSAQPHFPKSGASKPGGFGPYPSRSGSTSTPPAGHISNLNGGPPKRKTQLCRFFEQKGFCLNEDMCRFAHGEWELDPSIDVKEAKSKVGVGYKTQMCTFFRDNRGSCPRGAGCTFAHGQEELDKFKSGFLPPGVAAGGAFR